MDWLTIVQALLLAAMLVILYPSVKRALKNPTESKKGDWKSAIVPLLIVVVIVVVLIASVR